MAKPIINYKGYMTENPADRTGPKICIPQIVDRNQVLDLSEVIEKAIDRGLIAGLKSPRSTPRSARSTRRAAT